MSTSIYEKCPLFRGTGIRIDSSYLTGEKRNVEQRNLH